MARQFCFESSWPLSVSQLYQVFQIPNQLWINKSLKLWWLSFQIYVLYLRILQYVFKVKHKCATENVIVCKIWEAYLDQTSILSIWVSLLDLGDKRVNSIWTRLPEAEPLPPLKLRSLKIVSSTHFRFHLYFCFV